MTMQRATSRLTFVSAVCVVVAGCSEPWDDAERAQVAMTASGEASPMRADAGALDGDIFAASRITCSPPAAPLNGSVRAPQTRVGAKATYGCATSYTLVGDATRRCQANGTWTGNAPTCAFNDAGTPCGACGGVYDATGVCSVATPANMGSACNVGTGQGACVGAGTIGCSGTCETSDPAIGNPTAWHITPAANGSWDWDCDGVVTSSWVPTDAPMACETYTDADGCQAAPAVDYITKAVPCGEQVVVLTQDCQWTTFAPTCINTPASHRIVFQQCR